MYKRQVYSISAGLDYPGIGPEHAHLHDIGRAESVPVTDEEAVNAFEYLARTEGIIPAIESVSYTHLVPEQEFEECMNKARASLRALELAQEAEL